jgi:hypothetical protein
MCVCGFVCIIYIYIYIHVHMYSDIYIYIYIPTHTIWPQNIAFIRGAVGNSYNSQVVQIFSFLFDQ